MIVVVGLYQHRFDWAEQGLIDADLQVIGSPDSEWVWARRIGGYWFGPGDYQQVITMLAADLVLPGLGRVFSGRPALLHSRRRG